MFQLRSGGVRRGGRSGERNRRVGLLRLWLLLLLLMVQRQQFLPVYGHVARGLDAQANLAPIDVDHRNTDVLTDENLLAKLAAENQHCRYPPLRETENNPEGILRYNFDRRREAAGQNKADSDT